MGEDWRGFDSTRKGLNNVGMQMCMSQMPVCHFTPITPPSRAIEEIL